MSSYVVRLGDGIWLRRAEHDEDEETIFAAADPDEAAQFTSALAAAREVMRVSTGRPIVGGRLNVPLLQGGASVQRLEEARGEARGEES